MSSCTLERERRADVGGLEAPPLLASPCEANRARSAPAQVESRPETCHLSNVSGPKGVFPEQKGYPCHCTSRTPQNRLRLHPRQLGSLRRPPRPSGGDTSRVETVLTGSTGHAIQDPRRVWHARAGRILRHRLLGREMSLQRRTAHHTDRPPHRPTRQVGSRCAAFAWGKPRNRGPLPLGGCTHVMCLDCYTRPILNKTPCHPLPNVGRRPTSPPRTTAYDSNTVAASWLRRY